MKKTLALLLALALGFATPALALSPEDVVVEEAPSDDVMVNEGDEIIVEPPGDQGDDIGDGSSLEKPDADSFEVPTSLGSRLLEYLKKLGIRF